MNKPQPTPRVLTVGTLIAYASTFELNAADVQAIREMEEAVPASEEGGRVTELLAFGPAEDPACVLLEMSACGDSPGLAVEQAWRKMVGALLERVPKARCVPGDLLRTAAGLAALAAAVAA